ncbi:MAG: hypothetical protein LIV22_01525 [Olegusella sp.]|nr:hypothetical protein [Olegusella sp.]
MLASAVAVEYGPSCDIATRTGHPGGCDHEACPHAVPQPPARGHARAQVHGHGQAAGAARGPETGYAAHGLRGRDGAREVPPYEVRPRRRIPVRHRRPPGGIGADAAHPQPGHAFPDAAGGRACEAAVLGVTRQLRPDLAEAEAPPARVPYPDDGLLEGTPWILPASARLQPPAGSRPAHAQHTGHHRDAAARPLRQHQPESVLRQRLLAKKAAAFLGNPFSLPGSLMRLLAPPGSFCPSVLAWVARPVFACLRIQSFRVLPLVPSSAAHSRMLFFGSDSCAFLQCPAASSRYSSACCLGAFALALDSAFSISTALTDISLLQSAGGDGRAYLPSIPAAGSCRPAVHQKITAQGPEPGAGPRSPGEEGAGGCGARGQDGHGGGGRRAERRVAGRALRMAQGDHGP